MAAPRGTVSPRQRPVLRLSDSHHRTQAKTAVQISLIFSFLNFSFLKGIPYKFNRDKSSLWVITQGLLWQLTDLLS